MKQTVTDVTLVTYRRRRQTTRTLTHPKSRSGDFTDANFTVLNSTS